MIVRLFSLLSAFLLLSANQVAVGGQAPAGGGGGFAGSPDLPGNLFNSAHRVAQSTLKREWVYIPMGRERLRTLIIHPAGDGPAPVVLLMHYDAGLDDLQLGMAVQLARHGFIAVVPDLLSGLGPDGGNYDAFAFPDAALRAVRDVPPDEAMRRYKIAYEHARTLPRANGRVAALGSGLGGSHSFRFAAEAPELSAAVVFYGRPPEDRVLDRIKAPILGLYGGDDPDMVATVEPTAAAMKRLGKSYDPRVYPGATHFFLSYVVEGRNSEAIAAAWPAAIAFLDQHTRQNPRQGPRESP